MLNDNLSSINVEANKEIIEKLESEHSRKKSEVDQLLSELELLLETATQESSLNENEKQLNEEIAELEREILEIQNQDLSFSASSELIGNEEKQVDKLIQDIEEK